MEKSKIALAALVGTTISGALALLLFAQSGPAVATITSYASYAHANLLSPTGIWLSPQNPGYLFIADTGHNQIKMLTVGVGVTTIAGNGTAGLVNSTTEKSEFDHPTGIWGDGLVEAWDPNLQHVDEWISIYVQDTTNNVVRFVCKPIIVGTKGGGPDSVTTAAGTGPAGLVNGSPSSAEFHSPAHPALPEPSAPATFLIPDAANNVIRFLATTAGSVGTYAGTGTAGLANGYRTSAEFDAPTDIAADNAGNYYVADAGNLAIRKIDASVMSRRLPGAVRGAT